MDGKVEMFKVWRLAKGRILFNEVIMEKSFLLLVMMKSIWMLLDVVAYYNYEIW